MLNWFWLSFSSVQVLNNAGNDVTPLPLHTEPGDVQSIAGRLFLGEVFTSLGSDHSSSTSSIIMRTSRYQVVLFLQLIWWSDSRSGGNLKRDEWNVWNLFIGQIVQHYSFLPCYTVYEQINHLVLLCTDLTIKQILIIIRLWIKWPNT